VHGTIESLFRVEWRPLAELTPIAGQWRALAAEAIEPNVFYEPSFALAAGKVFGRDVGAGLVWSQTSPPRLVGFFPARVEQRRFGIRLPVLVGWTHPYAPLGTPLIVRDGPEAVISAWIDHIARHPQLPGLVLLPLLATEGAVARALDAVLARPDGHAAHFGRHRRALLAPADGRADYLEHAIGGKRRKELRRQRRRLGDCGVVMRGTTGEPDAVAAALDDFLALEAGGWKGRAGTAARADAELRSFLQSAVTALAGEGKARIDRLFIDMRAIAALVVLQSGRSAWAWKIAYDERFARASPGVQLLVDATRAMLEDPHLERADSCATADHPMIDHIWRERVALGDLLFCARACGTARFGVARTAETLRRAATSILRAARKALRR
jgi:CelD/BcsL family acetyltransferase involved in cellulose biosynthesis